MTLKEGDHVMCDGKRWRIKSFHEDGKRFYLLRLNKDGSVNGRCYAFYYLKSVADCTPIEETTP